MVFNAVLFIAVMVISGIFLYMSYTLKRDANKKVAYEGEYHIEIAGDFAGEDISIYINDSLLTKGIMPDTIVCLDINRFAEEHALMVVNNQTDSATPFNLDKKGSKIKLLKKDNEIIIEETPRTF
jgi:hypothetical protein